MIKIGCIDFPIPPSKYFKTWRLVEVQQTQTQFPGDGTVQRWMSESPPGFEFVVMASPLITTDRDSPYFKYQRPPKARGRDSVGSFRLNETTKKALQDTFKLASALKAQCIIFQSPPEFGPSRSHIDMMKRYFNGVDRGKWTFIWESLGDWPPKSVIKLCESLDLIPCVNPLTFRPLPEGLTAYFHLPGPAGYRSRYEEETLKEVLSICEKYEEVYCIFTNIDMHNDALRMKEVIEKARW